MSQLQAAKALEPELYINTTSSEKVLEGNTKKNSDLRFGKSNAFQLLTRFSVNNKVALTFSIDENVKGHYILIKGLIEFYRPKELAFSFNSIAKTISITLQFDHLQTLEKLFAEVTAQLHSEIRFKSKLKRIIAFEKRYKEEALLVYES